MKISGEFNFRVTIKGCAHWEDEEDFEKELQERIDSAVHQVIDDDFLDLETEVNFDYSIPLESDV